MRFKFAMVSLLLLCVIVTKAPAKVLAEFAFGITSATAFSLPHYIATEKKFYEAESLAPDTIVAGAAAQVLQQLAAGSLPIAQAATDQTLRAILRGALGSILGGSSRRR